MTTKLEFDGIKLLLDRTATIKVLNKLPEGTSKFCWRVEYFESGLGQSNSVLKFLKPLPAGARPWKNLEEEVVRLQSLRNSGIEGIEDVIVNGKCTVQLKTGERYDTEFVVCRFLRNTEPLGTLYQQLSPNYGLPFVLTLMAKLLPILHACHIKNCIHLDLHPNNIMVRGGTDPNTKETICEQVVLIDFATAVDVFELAKDSIPPIDPAPGMHTATVIDGYRGFLHRDLRAYSEAGKPVPRSVLEAPQAKRFDLFAAARCFEEVLLGARIPEDEEITEKSVSLELQKLRNDGSTVSYDIVTAMGHVELNRALLKRPILIRLAGETNTIIPKRFIPLIDSCEFQRLRRVYQLGLTHIVYPSATHSRFSHSIGVFHLCNQYISALQANSEIFRGMYLDKDLELLRVASLVHDVGHYPFAHYFEELWDKDKEKVGSTPIKVHHESLGIEVLKGNISIEGHGTAIRSELDNVLGGNGLQTLINFFEGSKPDNRVAILRGLLSGPIDCDKVDYLKRDGLACGVPYSDSIDIQRLLTSLTVFHDPRGSRYVLGITAKGLAPVESILNARYHMFSEVYWHKACRGIAALIKHALFRLLQAKPALSQSNFNRAMYAGDDWYVLKWLACKLTRAHMKDVADDLIRRPLLDCNRKALYQRLITFSAIWDGTSRNATNAWRKLSAIGTLRDYAALNELKEKLRANLNLELKSTLQAMGIPEIEEHQLLIDIPPAEDKGHRFPAIFYPETKNSEHVLSLNEVSGIHSTHPRYKNMTPLELTHKIRIFSTRAHAKAIRTCWPTTAKLGEVLSELLT